MVLFENDYKTHKCIIDTTTKNTSFIKMSILLRNLGVKNNKFMLVLVQADLQGVDPHSKNLTLDQKHKIAYECKVNPWYAFREVVKVPRAGADPGSYILNRANLALIWCWLNSIDNYLTMPRQIGKTIGVIGEVVVLMILIGKNINIGLFAKGSELRQENVDRLKELRNALPPYLFLSGKVHNTDNQEGLEYKPLKTKYITFVSNSDKKKAASQGRGQSHTMQHWDEFGYYTNNQLSYEAASAARDAASEQAIAAGIPACNIITTTAGELSSDFGRYAHSIKAAATPFTEQMYDCADVSELKSALGDTPMLYLEYSYKQLGKSEAWFRRVTAGKSPDIVARDYLNRWTQGSASNVLSAEVMDQLKSAQQEPIKTEFIEGLIVKWYIDTDLFNQREFRQIPFIIGGDTSDNVGRDFTTIVMINPVDMSLVMTCRTNDANLAYIVKLFISLLTNYPRSILIPERNKNGAAIIDLILDHFSASIDFDPFKRIFNQHVQNYSGSSKPITTLDVGAPNIRKGFGFTTTSSANSRPLLYKSVLLTMVPRNTDRIFDKTLIDELCTLTSRNGRIDHAAGAHDDMVISYLLACYLVMFGNNLNMYGIGTNELLSYSDNTDSSADTRGAEQQIIKSRINELRQLLDKDLSSLLKLTFERELRSLEPLLEVDNDIGEMISAHQIKTEQAEQVDDGIDMNKFTSTMSVFNRSW